MCIKYGLMEFVWKNVLIGMDLNKYKNGKNVMEVTRQLVACPMKSAFSSIVLRQEKF